ncbi:MAG: DUF4352 domain-containing protein, partial [Ktedonobacteraceae bacterium]
AIKKKEGRVMSQQPDDPFYHPPTENPNYPSWQQANQAPGNARPPSAPQSGYAPNQAPMNQPNFAPMNQPNFAPQGYPQQRPAPAYPGQSAGLPPHPQLGSLPKHYNFPVSDRGNPPAQRWLADEMPTPRQNPPPARPKKVRKGRVIASTIVLLLLIASGVGAFLVLRHSNTSTAKPTVHATATAATTQPSTGTTGTIGQPLQAGPNWVMTVTNVHATTTSDYPPKAGQTYLEISITLKNVSPNTLFVSSMIEFTLADTSSGQYTESVNDTYTHQAVDGHLSMNQTLTGQVAYQIPQAQHHFVLVFHYGLPDGSSDAVSWEITA